MPDNSYSVVIPAYNEAKWLPETLAALTPIMRTVQIPGEVIVVDNNSTDQTARIARDFQARVVFEPFNQISRARNAGARAAEGTFLIFLDADTLPSQRLIQTALHYLAAGACGGGIQVAPRETPSMVVRQTLHFWNRISAAFDLAAGCFIFCLRRGFEDIGGFSESVYAGEEILFSRKMRAWGKKRKLPFRIITHFQVLTSLRKARWLSLRQIFQLMLILLCPLALRIRALCGFWYRRRPEER